MNRGSSTVTVVAGIAAGLALVLAISIAIYRHDQPKVTCHWQVPLKVNYQACSDGTIKEVK